MMSMKHVKSGVLDLKAQDPIFSSIAPKFLLFEYILKTPDHG